MLSHPQISLQRKTGFGMVTSWRKEDLVSDPIELADFRPISLIRCVYKALSKVLSTRLASVIHKVVRHNQTAFISGRQILDGALLANKIILFANQSNLKLLCLKVDFEKAFDIVAPFSKILLLIWVSGKNGALGFTDAFLQPQSQFLDSLKISDLLEKTRRRFFWGFKEDERGMSWFNWKTVLSPFNKGGLGIGSIRAKNLALLGKWWWRFHVEKDALWNKAIGEIYGRDGGLSTPNGLGIKKGVWDKISSIGYTMHQLGISFSSSFWRLVGNRESILFWHDRWLDEGPCLKIRFPCLYALDENTNCRLNERLAETDGSWVLSSAWRSSPRGRSCNELNSLYSIIESCSLNFRALDGWKWTLGSGKDFTEKTLYVMVDSIFLEPYHSEQKFKWNSWVPRKINIFAWRAFNDRLPLLVNLDNRGLDVGSVLCPFCSNAPEDAKLVLGNQGFGLILAFQRKAPGNVGNTGARGKKVICYNCRGEGHVARQCKEPKRKMDSQYFKDKALLMEAKEKGDVLDAEAEAFLADVECTAPYDQPQALTTTNMFQANHEDAYDSDVDEGPNAAVAFMANLSSTSATNSQVNEVHSNDNQIFDNVDYQIQEMHQEEHLDSDAETEIDDNTIPYHQYLLDTEAQNVPTEVSADTSDKVSMIAILTDLQTQLDGHAKVNQEKCLEIETLKNELLQCKQEICRLDTHKVKLDLENKVRQEQALVIQRNKRNAELVQENDLLKVTLSGKEKSIAFLQSEKEKILSEKKDLADSYLDEIVCLKNANKVARDMLQRFNMPTQTIPMLSKKPKKATNDLHKDILGTRNPGLGYMAKRAQPVLYDADTLLHPNHHPVSIWDSEEVLVHQVVSMKKMNEKPGHVRPANDFYAKLNALMFVPQKELSGDQAYWLSANEIASNASNPATPVTPFVHNRPHLQVKFYFIFKRLMLFFINLKAEYSLTYWRTLKKLSALTAENTKLKAQVTGKTSSGPSTSENPKYLLQGCIPTVQRLQIDPGDRNHLGKQNKKPNVPVNLSTRTKLATESRKPMPKCHTRNHHILPSRSVNARRAADHNRKLHVVDHNQFVIRSLKSVGRTIADSITERLKCATTYVFRWFDLSLLSRSSTRTASIRKSDTSVLEDLKALSWKTCQEGSLLNLSDHSKYEHVGPKFSEWRIEEKITSNSRKSEIKMKLSNLVIQVSKIEFLQKHKCKTSDEPQHQRANML
ncbi:TRAF-type zinc finger domain-containing protein 1-like protein [Tanacetum coccineum]